MHFASSTVVLRGSEWISRLGELKEAGYDHVELWAAFGPDARDSVTFNYTDPNAVEAVADSLSTARISVHSMHGPMLLGPPTGNSPFGYSGLSGLIEAECAGIDAVMALGGRFLVTQDAAEREPPDAPHLASEPALRQLADYAAEHGCVFCIENGAEDPEGIERLIRLVHEIAHPGLGICLDVGHAQAWCYNDVPRAIREAGHWLRTCHLHDNIGVADAHLRVGDGILPWHAILEALRDVGYRGPLLCESWSGGGRGQPVDVLARSRMLLESLADSSWDPIAVVAGLRLFRATDADRSRARNLMGADGIGDGPAGRSVLVADRFGDPIAWAELHRAPESRLEFVGSSRLERFDAAAVARAAIEALMDGDGRPKSVRAGGLLADALRELGCESADDGSFSTHCIDSGSRK